MSGTPGIVIAVNWKRRVGVVRLDNGRHAVVGLHDVHGFEVGDVLLGDFDTSGSMTLLNLTTGETVVAHQHFVDRAWCEAGAIAIKPERLWDSSTSAQEPGSLRSAFAGSSSQ
jgi:hypothetical protein